MTDEELIKRLREGQDLHVLAACRIEQLNRLLDEMAQLLRVADFEDLGDYHASLDVLSKYKEISND